VNALKGRSPERLREICEAGEAAARKYLLSNLERKLIRSLEIDVISETSTQTTFNVDISLELEPGIEIDLEKLIDEASEAALSAIDKLMKRKKRAQPP
jgi:hypothetical protein